MRPTFEPADDEWTDWYGMTPTRRREESLKL
jgi:hypothetical protein